MFGGCGDENDFASCRAKCETPSTLEMCNELNEIYQERLMAIGDSGEANQFKVKMLEDWVSDLTEQNKVLVQTVEALEKEALNSLGVDLSASRTGSVQEVKGYNTCNSRTGSTFRNAREMISQSSDELRLSDADLRLQEALQKLKQSEHEIERLKNVLAENDAKLFKCKEDFIVSEKSAKEMRAALTAEVAEKHDQVLALRREVQHLEDKLRQADMQTHFKDDIIKELRKEIKISSNKLQFLGLNLKPPHVPNANNIVEHTEDMTSAAKGPSHPVYKHITMDDMLNSNKPAECTIQNISRGTSPHRSVQVKAQSAVDTSNLVLNPDIESSSFSNRNKHVSLKMTFSSNDNYKIAGQRKKLNKKKTSDNIPEKSGRVIMESSCGDYLNK